MEFQTRSEETGLRQFETMNEALNHANNDKSVWKISFSIPETRERIRLVKTENVGWVLEAVYN